MQCGRRGIPYLNTYDGRTIRYPDPLIKANDTIKLDLDTYKITDFIKFEVGNIAMVMRGRKRTSWGHKEEGKTYGHLRPHHCPRCRWKQFASLLENVHTSQGSKPWVSLPKGKGIKLSIIEEARLTLEAERAF